MGWGEPAMCPAMWYPQALGTEAVLLLRMIWEGQWLMQWRPNFTQQLVWKYVPGALFHRY